jgi:FRG domain-containing protein
LFSAIRIEHWKQALEIAEELGSGWVFRGHGDTSWQLETRIERDALRARRPLDSLANRERWILQEFQRRAHHYLDNLPDNECVIEWLSLIQHHGGPTRLLDVSQSFYVAAFFAMETASSDAAIWAFNLFEILRRLHIEPKEYLDQTLNRHTAEAEQVIRQGALAPKVLPIQPYRLNERLSIQKGLFLFPCHIGMTFLDNLTLMLNESSERVRLLTPGAWPYVSYSEVDKEIAIKLQLPRQMHETALFELENMNINAVTLFPGLDGFARSLSRGVRLPGP